MSRSVWIHYARPRPHWYLLPESERHPLEAAWNDVREKAGHSGASRHGGYHIRGQHDFETVEIWDFPSTVAAFEHWAALCAARYNEFFAFSNNIGLAMDDA